MTGLAHFPGRCWDYRDNKAVPKRMDGICKDKEPLGHVQAPGIEV